jgi:hypothetical protein
MNENCVREMTFIEEAKIFVRESEQVMHVPSNEGAPNKEIALIIHANRCIKKGIDELEQLKKSLESLQKEYSFYRGEYDRAIREFEIALKAVCKLIR